MSKFRDMIDAPGQGMLAPKRYAFVDKHFQIDAEGHFVLYVDFQEERRWRSAARNGKMLADRAMERLEKENLELKARIAALEANAPATGPSSP